MFTRVDIKEVLERLKEFKPPYSLTAYIGGVEVFSVDKLTARDIRERLEKFSDKSSYIVVRFDALNSRVNVALF